MMINRDRLSPCLQDLPDQGGLVPHRGEPRRRKPGLVEPPGDVPGIAVGRLAGDQLGAGGDDLALHHGSSQLSAVSSQLKAMKPRFLPLF